MRYNLESTLPLNAFKPRGKGPFAHGMTLEGGGGGGIGSVLGGVAKGVTDVVKGVVKPVYDATLKNIPGVDKALVSLDKSVGKAIPGGWGTVASVASSFIPGAALATMGLTQTGLATGLGALSGSGVMRGDHQFNLQGAIMGGAMAYGASQLSSAFQNAGQELANTPTGANANAVTNAVNPGSGYVPEGGMTGNFTPPSAPTPPPGAGVDYSSGLSQMPGNAAQPYTPPPSMLDKVGTSISNIPSNIQSGITSLGESGSKFLDTATNPDTYSNLGSKALDTVKGTASNMSDAVSGVGKVLSGSASLPTGTLTGAALPMIIGGSGLAALEEQKKYLEQQAASGSISNAEYNAQVADINAQIETAKKAVAANPLQSTVDTSNISEGPSLYSKNTTGSNTLYDTNPTGGTTLYEQNPVKVATGGIISGYATGGNVLMNPPDDQTGMPNQTPMGNFEQGGIASMIGNTVPKQTFATGGIARFLSGGGDGMSDSIPASINGKQEARLADGEFVIPADVVSHIGNGSSKAGAKQLYSMMDRVRQARVGTKKQGKQINPRKYLAA